MSHPLAQRPPARQILGMGRRHRIMFAGLPPEKPKPTSCWLCERPLGAKVQWHHPHPKSRGGKETVPVHPICHRAIHAHFSNRDLERDYTEAEALRAAPAMARFLAWVADKPADFHAPTRQGQRDDSPSFRLLNQEA